MGPDSLRADVKSVGDGLGGMPFGNELHDLALTAREHRECRAPVDARAAFAEVLHEHTRHPGTDVDLIGEHRTGSAEEFLEGAVLQEIARGAGVHDGRHEPLLVVDGQAQRAGPRRLLRDARDGLDAVQPGHREIGDDQIRLQFPDEAHEFRSVSRFRHDLEVRGLPQQRGDSFTEDAVVIGKNDSDGHGLRLSGRSVQRVRPGRWSSTPGDGSSVTGTLTVTRVPAPGADST